MLPTTATPGPRLWSQPGVRAVVWVSMAAFTSFFLTQAALPLWAVAGGASASVAGLVITSMLVITVAAQTQIGSAVRRFGVGPVLAVGLILLGAPAPAYLVRHTLWWLAIDSGVRGVGFAVITVLLPILATRAAPAGRSGAALGLYGVTTAVPNLLAVPGGVALTAAGRFDVVAALGAAPLLALPWVPALSRIPAASAATTGPPLRTTRRTVAAIAGVTLVLLTVTLSGSGLITFLPIERPAGAVATVALLVFGGAGAGARWAAGMLADRIDVGRLMPGGIVLFSAGMIVVAAGLTGGSGAWVITGAVVAGLGFGAVQNLTLITAFAIAGPAQATLASATWNAAFDSGAAVGALAVGWIAAGGVGLAGTFVGCAVLVLLTVPLAVRGARRVPARR